ncbi:MAG: FAD-dependent oxidoreductase [Dehalococcoidia bacterium]|jgi:NADPH-dependent 2,4-dienoyl-CoA reductase/sulfur reductase-like enzyme
MLIIGGSDAGISAALRIKELNPQTDVTVVVADAYPGFSICGLPFFLSGEVPDRNALAHHSLEEFEKQGIRLVLNHRAEAISHETKRVRVISHKGQTWEITYDKLLIATGAESARPPIAGLDQAGVFLLRWMADGFAMQQFMEQKKPRRTVIIGGGYIGLEVADALTRRGQEVTVLEFTPEILTTLDPIMGRLIRTELESKGVKVITGRAVQSIEHKNDSLLVHTASGETSIADMVLVGTGVKPSTKLAQTAGIALGVAGAIQVDRTMATNIPDILAAGDCAETWHHVLKSKVYIPLGTTAHKQGRIAGENMVGGNREFQGSLGTQAVKVFGRIAAGTGLRDVQAAGAGFDPLTVTMKTPDHNAYYPGAKEMTICITGDRRTGRLLGAQIVGHSDSEVAKRIDIIAATLYNGLSVEDLCDLDLSYTPPLSSPWDPVQKAAMHWSTILKGKT